MNYAGKFGSGASDTFLGAGLNIDSLAHHGGGDTVTIPDAHLLFSGDYSRSGADLIVSDQLHRVVVPNYFQGDKRPMLVSPEGAPLDPQVIEALTGHVQYAQAAGTAAAGKVVGHVIKMTGSASVVRNGVTVTLNDGDNVYQNDVVQTGSGSTLGLVLIDGTTFNLTAGARLMLNDLTYEAASTSNTSLFTLVQGAASFVAGQVAKTGDMKVGTPVATMGIRGTAVILDISSVDGKVSVSVIDQRDGQVHSVQVFNTRGVLIGTVTSSGSGLTLTPTTTFEVIAQESNKTVAQVAQEFNAFQTLLQIYDAGKQLFPDLPQHTDANPNSTRYASGSTISPINSTPLPINNVEEATTGTQQTKYQTGSPQTTEFQTTVVLNIDGAPAQQVTITPTVFPFVVTPPTITRISGGDGNHVDPVMSADGQFVAYDPDGIIYYFDRESGATTRVTPAGDGFSYTAPAISSDGRYIVYQGTNGTDSFVFIYGTDPSDVVHYHHQILIASGTSPVISGDGSRILVEHGGGSIGIYDQQGHELAAITPASVGVSGSIWRPAISADGHVIAFWSSDSAAAGGSGQLFVYDLSAGSVTAIAGTASGAGTSAASISADGHYVVYQSEAAGGHSEIYLYDLTAGHVVFHTANATGASYRPVISPDGDFIIFASDAQLTPDDINSFADTYIVDVTDPDHPVYTLVSVGGNAASNLGAAISTGGLFLAFGSNATNFPGIDTSGAGDIFVSDPSGYGAIIQETANSPAILTASGIIALTGDLSGVALSFSDPNGRFHASFDSSGDIQWTFSEQRSDFDSLPYGQDVSQQFVITLSGGGNTATIPVTVTVHNAVQPTIEVANTAPIIHDATLAVSEGGAVLLGPSDIGVADLTDSSFTFTVSNVTHGTFQTTTDGVTWVDATTFTTADLAASHVRFVHDGGEIAPTFSIQADDGEALNHQSNVSAGAVDFTNVDDPAEICGKATGSVVEDTSCTTGGTLTVHDPDSGEAVFQAVPAAALAGIYGNFAFDSASGVWSYELVHSQADSLVAGQVVHDTLTVTSADGTASQVIDVAIIGTNDAPVILSETDAPTQAVMVISPSPVVLGSGVNTNSLGLNTETFDGQSTGSSSNNGQCYGDFHSAALNATFSGSGRAGVVSGSSPGVTAAPFIGPLPGTTDTSHYLSIGAGGTETIRFATEVNAFGLYWGSVDSYNAIAFYHGTTLVASYSGADVAPLFANGNQGSFSSNGYVEFSGLASFDRVVLGSNSNAFEIDNISAGFLPVPHVQLAAPISGTITVSDADIGDTLTASVIGNATIHYNGSATLPGNASAAALIAASAVTFDSVQSDGGTEVLHWTYDPANPALDFLKAGDTLTITYLAQVNDGHGSVGNQPLTITIVGAAASADTSAYQVVNGTSADDTFHNVGAGVTVFGAGGQDTFVFNAGFGSATIGDFDVNQDVINIDHTLFADVSAILDSAQSANSGQDTIITDAAHDSITLTGVTVAQLQANPNGFHLV